MEAERVYSCNTRECSAVQCIMVLCIDFDGRVVVRLEEEA